MSYPHHVLEGEFNTMVIPSIDGHNMHSGCALDWLPCKVTTSPPTLIVSFRRLHPDQRAYTTYPQAHHTSECRIDMIFFSSPTASFLTPQSSFAESNDLSTNHQPVTLMATGPALPFHDHHSI